MGKRTSNKLKNNPVNLEKEHQKAQQVEHEEAMAKCIPVAREVLKIIHEEQLDMGDISDQATRPEKYVTASTRIRQLMIDSNLPWIDRHFVFQLALQPVDKLKDIVLSDLARSYEDGMTSLLGVGSFTTMTMGDMQKAFMKRFEENVKPKTGDLAIDPAMPE